MDLKKFEHLYSNYFEEESYDSLIFEMGGNISLDAPQERVQQVITRFQQIANDFLNAKSIWIILAIWDENRGTYKDLTSCGFNISNADFSIKIPAHKNISNFTIEEGHGLYYIYFEKYQEKDIIPIISAIAGYELAVKKSANINAYIMTFDDVPVLLNLYDDRGLEIISKDIAWIKSKTNVNFHK